MHRFGGGDFIILGGMCILHKYGLVTHPDGDVLPHALFDAPFGATALGDISKHFPDTDLRFKGADSHALLRHVVTIVAGKDWKVDNVDATIIAQAPRMIPHIKTMRGLIVEDLGVTVDQISIKATTTERLGPTEYEEGTAVYAVALLMA